MGNKIFFVIIIIACFTLLAATFTLCKAPKKEKVIVDANLIKLGRYLFFDRRLSINNTRSCGTCHNPDFGFTDGYKRSVGAFADLHQRNTQPVINLSYFKYLTSADSSLHQVGQQMLNPLFNQHPVEMGVAGNEKRILKRLEGDTLYRNMFRQSFPDIEISIPHIITAISSFLYTITSTQSPYDAFLKGDATVFSISAKRGMQLFFSSKLNCASCHGGFNFSTPSVINEKGDTIFYFNTGLYNIGATGAYPEYDEGLYQYTKVVKDIGSFRVPTLRNLGFTAPYFHDGSAETLEEVIAVYENGGRIISKGIYKGDGRKNPYKHSLISGFKLNSQERKDLISFLLSLSDSSVLKNPAYANPFIEDETRQ
jgi:cytochrome c peroxidase